MDKNKKIKDLLIAHSSGKVYLTNDHNIERITISEHANSLIDALSLLLQAERERCAKEMLLSPREYGKQFRQFVLIRHMINQNKVTGYAQIGESMICLSQTKYEELCKANKKFSSKRVLLDDGDWISQKQ